MARSWRILSRSVVCLLAAGCLAATAGAQDDAKQEARLAAMRAIAKDLTFGYANSGNRAKPGLRNEPIYRFNDPARAFFDGTVWAWGRSGRPQALLTIAPEKLPNGWHWLCELTDLAADPLSVMVPGAAVWTPPAGAGLDFRTFPQAGAPAGEESRRGRQMKDLARNFKAFEFFAMKQDAVQERYELRLLPQPIVRYSDEAAGIVDGALFFFVYGNNPEIVLLIEASRQGGGTLSWHYAISRIAGAELHVKLGDQEVWTQPRHFNTGTREPYWIFIRPLSEGGE